MAKCDFNIVASHNFRKVSQHIFRTTFPKSSYGPLLLCVGYKERTAIEPFIAVDIFLYPLKTSKNLDIF